MPHRAQRSSAKLQSLPNTSTSLPKTFLPKSSRHGIQSNALLSVCTLIVWKRSIAGSVANATKMLVYLFFIDPEASHPLLRQSSSCLWTESWPASPSKPIDKFSEHKEEASLKKSTPPSETEPEQLVLLQSPQSLRRLSHKPGSSLLHSVCAAT